MSSSFHTVFTQPALHRQIWSLAWPLMLSNLTVPLLGLVDTAVIGHLDSAHYLGGVAISSTLFMVIYFAFNFLRMGTTGLSAQAYGKNKSPDEATAIVWHGLLIAGVIGFLLIVFRHTLIESGIYFIGGSQQVKEQAQIYSEIRILGAPATLGVFVIIGWLIGVQKTRGPLLLLLFANSLNIILDVLLVVVLDMKVAGAAWATVTADYSGFALGLFIISRLRKNKKLFPLIQIPHWPLIKSMLVMNSDIFIRTAILLAVFSFFTAQGARLSDSVLAANAVLINFLLLISNALDGFANATEALCGAAISKAKQHKHYLQQVLWNTALWSALSAVLLSLLFLLGGRFLIGQLTNINEVANLAQHYIGWVVILPLTAAAGFWLDGVFIGFTLTRSMRNSMFLATVLVFIPIWYLSRDLGNHGLWLSLNSWMLARGLFMGYKLYQYSSHSD